MIFYCSPTKTLKASHRDGDNSLLFKTETEFVLNHLRSLDKSELKEFYHASDKIVEHQYHGLQHPTILGPAGYVYQGAVFKNLDLETLDHAYFSSTLFIGSALYGLTTINTCILDYRLDFTKDLKGINLLELYKPLVTKFFKQRHEVIIDVASQEYGALIEDCPKVQITFLDNDKIKSTYAKIARGQFLRACAYQQVDSIKQLTKLKILNYEFDALSSTTNHIIFRR